MNKWINVTEQFNLQCKQIIYITNKLITRKKIILHEEKMQLRSKKIFLLANNLIYKANK